MEDTAARVRATPVHGEDPRVLDLPRQQGLLQDPQGLGTTRPARLQVQCPAGTGEGSWAVRRLRTCVGLCVLSCSCLALDINDDPKPEEAFFAQAIGFPMQRKETVFRAGENRANFTFLAGVEGVGVRDGNLTFTLTDSKATLGWGNYAGKQPVAEIEDMWRQSNVIGLKLKQTGRQTKWTARLWGDGESERKTATATVAGDDWQEVAFKALETAVTPDGIEFTVEGDEGTRIELAWLKLSQDEKVYEGYCRAEFTVPAGKVWRAIAEVGGATERHWFNRLQIASRLYINGNVVERPSALSYVHTAATDIAPRLKPGRNCVGFYGFKTGWQPLLYFQARIIMESGEDVTVASGDEWRCNAQAAEGWCEPGFDDSAWTNVKKGMTLHAMARDMAGRSPVPAYNGRLVMEHPNRCDLFYSETEDVLLDVRVPAGLKRREPTLSYVFGKADAEGVCTMTEDGAVASYTERDGSLVYRLNVGRQAHGIYVLGLVLKAADGTIIEERHREPLAVLHRLEQKTIEGDDYVEGLDLELEDTVDFTDPDDPHPWVEGRWPVGGSYGPGGKSVERVTEPVIVRKAGLVYREVTGPGRGSGFSYRIEFRHPGSFYYMALDYPDDAKRNILVTINSKTEGVWSNARSGTGAETGGRFLPTGTMQKLQWLHTADHGPHAVDVINIFDGEKGAAKSLRIYRIKGDLPSVGAGRQRLYGIHTERCSYGSGIGRNFGIGLEKPPNVVKQENESWSPMRIYVRDLVWMKETGERYVQYLRFAGQNCHVMGCIQYNELNTPFVPAPTFDDPRVRHCLKTMMANLFEMNGIDFYAGIEYPNSTDVRTFANNAQVAEGADTVWMVDAGGRQRYNERRKGREAHHDMDATAVQNWLHPHVRHEHRQLMEDLARTFGHLSRFRGVHGLLCLRTFSLPGFSQGTVSPDPLASSYDDVTMALFERDTGTGPFIAQEDPGRFAKRAFLLSSPALRERFIAWRCEKLKEYCSEMLRALRDRREDLAFVNALGAGMFDIGYPRHFAESGRPFEALMKEFGLDVKQLNAMPGLWTGRWVPGWWTWHMNRPAHQMPYSWPLRSSSEIASVFDHDTKRLVLVANMWDENFFGPGTYEIKGEHGAANRLVESDWIMSYQRERGQPQASGYYCREAFTHALITGDANLLLGAFTDTAINVGHEQMLRSLLKTYTYLPPEKFRAVLDTGLDTNLAIRQLSKGGESFLYVANPGWWHISGEVALSMDGDVTELVSGNPVTLVQKGQARELAVSLTPFGLAAYRVNAPDLEIAGYGTRPISEEELGRLTDIIKRMVALMRDPVVRFSLSADDQGFVWASLKKAFSATKAREYALAWSLLTHPRAWSLWQDHLEKAATERPPSETAATADDNGSRAPRIEYDEEHNCVQVVGFPEDAPATMDAILAADRKERWDRLSYSRTTDSYTLDAALWIGDDQSNGTFLQIGSKRHPKATLVVKGTVWVRPAREIRSSDGLNGITNRLTLGDPADKSIRTTLKIACERPGQHGLYVGFSPPRPGARRDQASLHVYNSTITAATPDRPHAWGTRDYTGKNASPRWQFPGWYSRDIRLINSVVSWFEGRVTNGVHTGRHRAPGPLDAAAMPSKSAVIEGTTFEHGGIPIVNGDQYMRNCVFRDLEIGVAEGGSLRATLVNCTFEGNQSNWTLGSWYSAGITMLDCKVAPQRKPIAIKKNQAPHGDLMDRNLPLYPTCVEKQSLVVKVVDAAGKPVPQALVVVNCKDAPEEAARGAGFTDANGMTPTDPETDAIVITTRMTRATDDPDEPEVKTFDYRVTVQAAGFRTRSGRLRVGKPIPRPLMVTLGR